jgi:DNA-binding transcriptional ArsR family regulator
MPKDAPTFLNDPAALAALTHPLRIKLLNHLMSGGPTTASQAARAVGDTPSNSSYHLRILAKFGWVAPGDSDDGRERPWRALVTRFTVDLGADPESPAGRNALALTAMTVQESQQEAREALARFRSLNPEWQRASSYGGYLLRVTPGELAELTREIDMLLRPYMASTRDERPEGSAVARFAFQAFPKEDGS